MGSAFLETCALVDADNDALYRRIVQQCVAAILDDKVSAEVFLLALEGLFANQPSAYVLERQTKVLVARFAPSTTKKGPIVTNLSSQQELVVVTGASRGIGAATARELAGRGFHVLAGVRRDEDGDALRTANLEPLLLDITDEAGIAALLQRIADDPGHRRLRALVNNAGMAVNAPLETYPLSDLRRLFEVNLFGHVAMMQALLPALIESRGTIVNISSVGGKVAMATYGPYAGTKFALEAVSDSSRRELRPLGVKVVVIEPGAVTTAMLEQVDRRSELIIRGMTDAQRGRYAALMHAVVMQAQTSAAGAASPEEAARLIAEAINSKRPRTRYTIGRSTAIIVRLIRLLSDRMLDHMLSSNLRPYFQTERKD